MSLFSPALSTGILDDLLRQEDRVLESWTQKKKRLDQCLQYVLFERSARQVRTKLMGYILSNKTTIWNKERGSH